MGYIIDNKEIAGNSDVGIGVTFPFSGNKIFNSSYTTIDQAITNVKNLLLTMRGDRIYQPNFGTDLLGALFQPATYELKQFIVDDITNAITYWLPYINIIELNVLSFEDDPALESSMNVILTFSVDSSNAQRSITINADEGLVKFSSVEPANNIV